MSVLIVKVWAVAPEVFLPHLSYQMSVSAEHLLMASCQHFVKRCYFPLLQTGGPLGVALDMAPLRAKISIGSGE